MKLIDRLKDRYNILLILTFVICLILSFKLATLTIVEGDMYRNKADNQRIRKLTITAPRGEIRDRYGRLLAGNKLSFTVQILKDELNIKDSTERNKVILDLVSILNEDSVEYIDEFPININEFIYKDESQYFNDTKKPQEKVIDLILENDLIDNLILSHSNENVNDKEVNFIVAKRAIDILRAEKMSVPIEVKLGEDNFLAFYFTEDVDIKEWKKNNNIPLDMTAKDALLRLVGNDRNILRKILDNPVVRKLCFEILNDNNLASDIALDQYSFSFDQEYRNIKRSLMKNFSEVTMTTTAKEDFVNIVLHTSINDLLSKVIVKKDDDGKVIETIVPGKILLDKLEENNIYSPIDIEIDTNSNTVEYRFKSEKDKARFLSEESQEDEIDPLDALIYLGIKTGFIKDVIVDDKIKVTSQELILGKNINPKISITNWEYVPINNKNNWMKRYNIPLNSTAKEALQFLKNRYKIDYEISDYYLRSMLVILDQIDSRVYGSYQPINIAYDISNITVAKIEENKLNLPGINISTEPVRYYPMGKTAAHILGYLGKISQPFEINKYINELGYSPNDIIGKMGVEEKFETYLNGKDGFRRVEVDAFDNTINVIDEGKYTPGDNLFLTIDAKLQKTAEESLKQALEQIQIGGEYKSKWGNYKYGINKSKGQPYKNATSGAAVAIDVKTGEILALANYPAFDPNLFVTGISASDWESLLPENEEDPLAPKPLYNIALQTAIQPGSTFKMITGLAALENGFSPDKKIRDMGYVEIGNRRFGCWIWNSYGRTHGYENLYEAIRDSCNYYFYSLTLGENPRTGEDLGVQVDIEDIIRLCEQFGLNKKTGIEIDIPAESSGIVPSPNKKVSSMKWSLERFLRTNIEKYIMDGKKLDDEELEKIISEISSWTELKTPLSRNEVIRRLKEMGVDGEKILEGERENLADKIKYTYLNQAGWNAADTLNISIGQGENSYTPIQMANYVATLANGGYRHKTSVVKEIKKYDNSEITYEPERYSERINLNNYENLEIIKKGMLLVTTEGSAKSIFKNLPVKVGAKTGTAQRSGINPVTGETYDEYAWFVAFAPYDDPQIAVSVVIFQGGNGGYAGPVARDIIAEYLGLNNLTKNEFLYENKLVR